MLNIPPYAVIPPMTRFFPVRSFRTVPLTVFSKQSFCIAVSCAISTTITAQTITPALSPVLGFQKVATEEGEPELGFGLQPQPPAGNQVPAQAPPLGFGLQPQPPAEGQAPAEVPPLGFGVLAPEGGDPLSPLSVEPIEFPESPDLSLPDDSVDGASPDFVETQTLTSDLERDDSFAANSWWNFPGATLGSAQAPGVISSSNQTFSGFTNGFMPSPYGWDNSLLDGLAFSASLSGTYDSNPSLGLAGANNSGGDFFMTLGGTAAYRSPGREWNYGLNYSGSYNQYFSQSDLSGYNQNAGASLNYQGGPLTASFNLGVGFGSGANRYYQSEVDETSVNYSFNASYQYSPKTILTGNFSQSLTSSDGGFGDTGSFSLSASALWIYSARTQFGPGIRYSSQSGDTQLDRTSIGPTMTVNYLLSQKLSLNSQVGLDFAEFEGGESADTSMSASIGLNYRASELWGMNLSLNSGTQASPSAAGQYEQRTSLRVGYDRRIRRASWNVGVSYENSGFDAPSTVVGGANGSRDFLSFDTSLSMPVFADTTAARIFFRYSDETGGNAIAQGDSYQIGFSLSRGF